MIGLGRQGLFPLWEAPSFLLVRNLHETTLEDSDQKTLLDYVAHPTLDSCLIITANKVDRKRKLYKMLTSQKGAVLCEAPQEAELIP